MELGNFLMTMDPRGMDFAVPCYSMYSNPVTTRHEGHSLRCRYVRVLYTFPPRFRNKHSHYAGSHVTTIPSQCKRRTSARGELIMNLAPSPETDGTICLVCAAGFKAVSMKNRITDIIVGRSWTRLQGCFSHNSMGIE